MIKIQINSRLVKPGDTFVAIKGTVVDGHNYVEDAIKNGATTVVVSNKQKYSVKTINVKNTSKYLNIVVLIKHSAPGGVGLPYSPRVRRVPNNS